MIKRHVYRNKIRGLVILHIYIPFGHCIVCPSLIYDFCLTLWYLKLFFHNTLITIPNSGIIITKFLFEFL